MRIIRVFPRRTKATPDDDMSFCGAPPAGTQADEVHVSVTFTWDIPKAIELAELWKSVGRVEMAGPALGTRGEKFVPGVYLKHGYVITSRGCPNKCWFCSVWKREGETVRELPIVDGWNVLDDNLLACSQKHVCNVIEMLKSQKTRAQFTGGLEAYRLESWSIEAIRSVKPKQVFFAYDTPDDWEPLVRAANMCWKVGFTKASHSIRAYVLCGWPKDTIEQAECRMQQVIKIGIMPMAMLWRDQDGLTNPTWRTFQRVWARPCIIGGTLK